jgi:hypothetical protein
MRTLMLAVAACAALSASACGGTSYVNSQKSPAQRDQDLADCDWEASRSTGNMAAKGERKDRVQELIEKCMKAKGYKID